MEQNCSGLANGIGATWADPTEFLNDWVSMSHLLCGRWPNPTPVREADNFARYLKESPLSSLPEAARRCLSPGGQSLLNGGPDAADEALFEMGLQQDVADARRRGFFLNIVVRISSNQDDRGIDVPAL